MRQRHSEKRAIMNCEVCGKRIQEGETECQQCGFPVILLSDDDTEGDERIKTAVEQYRRRLCDKAEIGFYAYSHKIVKQQNGSEQLMLDRSDQVLIGTGGEIGKNMTIWYPEGFLRPRSGSLTCKIFVRLYDQSEVNWTLTFRIPSGDADLHIGLKKVRTDAVCICLTDNDGLYQESGEIQLL